MAVNTANEPAPEAAVGTEGAEPLLDARDVDLFYGASQALRNVTSSTGRPPATKARAKGTAWARSSITKTGMMGA